MKILNIITYALGILFMTLSSCKKEKTEGCKDSSAINYNQEADQDCQCCCTYTPSEDTTITNSINHNVLIGEKWLLGISIKDSLNCITNFRDSTVIDLTNQGPYIEYHEGGSGLLNLGFAGTMSFNWILSTNSDSLYIYPISATGSININEQQDSFYTIDSISVSFLKIREEEANRINPSNNYQIENIQEYYRD